MHDHSSNSRAATLGPACDNKLGRACEQRLGQIVHAAATVELHRLASPAGCLHPRKPERLALALTDDDLWLLEFRYRMLGFDVGAPLCHLPRHGLVVNWRRRRLPRSAVWRAEFCWPYLATYIEGDLVNCEDAERVTGLLASDELERELAHCAPAPD